MTKILLWVVVIFAVLVGLRLLNAAKAKRRADEASRAAGHANAADTMVRCTRCGIYLPRADARPGPSGLTCGDAGCTQRR